MRGILDAFDHPVRRPRVDHHTVGDVLHRLVVGAVDRHARSRRSRGAARCRRRPRPNGRARCAGSAARAPARPCTSSGMCWISVPPSTTFEQLLPAADAEHRHVARQRARGAPRSRRPCGDPWCDLVVPRRGAEQGGIDVEGAAGHDQRVDPLGIGAACSGSCGSSTGRRRRPRTTLGVVLAQRIPRQLGIAAGRLAVEGDTDHGSAHFLLSISCLRRAIWAGPVPQQPPMTRAPAASHVLAWTA